MAASLKHIISNLPLWTFCERVSRQSSLPRDPQTGLYGNVLGRKLTNLVY